MIKVSPLKLKALLTRRGVNLSALARTAGVSRQSLYLLLKGAPVYNSPFLKIIETLGVEPEAISEKAPARTLVLHRAPLKIRKVTLELADFCHRYGAALILFGSRAGPRPREASDWDFGVHFRQSDQDRKLRALKADLRERVFPYRMDVVNLTRAPRWFVESVMEEHVVLAGTWPIPQGAPHDA